LKILGKKLIAIRLSKGLTREYVAFDLNISISTISKIEQGASDLTVSRQQQMVKVFKTNIPEMLTYGTGNANFLLIPGKT
jgi:transcriptional regulator with XRE-family HTH domain